MALRSEALGHCTCRGEVRSTIQTSKHQQQQGATVLKRLEEHTRGCSKVLTLTRLRHTGPFFRTGLLFCHHCLAYTIHLLARTHAD